MKVSCPSCTSKYSIADEKVRNRLAKIRCRKCGTTIVIDGKTDPPTIQSADATVGRPDEYTVDVSETDQRQMNVEQIVQAYNDGVITADTYVWKDGMADWEALAGVSELNEALHRAAAQASMPPAVSYAPIAQPAPAIQPSTGGLFSSGVASSRAATRAAGGVDLFSGIDRVGSETDLATSAAEMTAALPNTGARNESSVLFSLSSLTANEPAAARSKVPTNEDSGLIDLAALAAQTDRTARSDQGIVSAVPPPFGSPLGAPLVGGTTAPLGAEAMGRQAAPNRNGLYIGGGIAVAAMVLGGVFLLREPPPPALQPIAIPTALPSTPTEVAAPEEDKTKEDESDSDKAADKESDDDQASATDDTKTAKTTKKRYSSPRPSPKPSSNSNASSSKASDSNAASDNKSSAAKAADTEKPKPKRSNCNCKSGDLMCAMKCSAKSK